MERNPLNDSDISGNTLNIGIDDEDDKFHCSQCNEDIYEFNWNYKRSMCFDCWWKI